MHKKMLLIIIVLTLGLVDRSDAQETVRIGFTAPITGEFAQNGKEMIAAAKFFLEENGAGVAGKKIELIVRDDGGVPDQAKRIAQEFIVNDKVAVLAGFNVTPVALAVAPLSAEAKVPQIVMAAGTSVITERSPYIVRTFFTLAQATVPIATWAAKNNIKNVVTMVSDYAPGRDAEKAFSDEFVRPDQRGYSRFRNRRGHQAGYSVSTIAKHPARHCSGLSADRAEQVERREGAQTIHASRSHPERGSTRGGT